MFPLHHKAKKIVCDQRDSNPRPLPGVNLESTAFDRSAMITGPSRVVCLYSSLSTKSYHIWAPRFKNSRPFKRACPYVVALGGKAGYIGRPPGMVPREFNSRHRGAIQRTRLLTGWLRFEPRRWYSLSSRNFAQVAQSVAHPALNRGLRVRLPSWAHTLFFKKPSHRGASSAPGLTGVAGSSPAGGTLFLQETQPL